MSNLWWAYDSEENSFSTLPAGPFLVPALIICTIAVGLRSCLSRPHSARTVAGPLAQTDHWQQKYNRYQELIKRQVETNNDLELHERHELRTLSAYIRNPYGRKDFKG